jgi:diguanylate cyclase (GGDEF)-like protein
MKILFVAANPASTPTLSVDEELRAIEHAIAASHYRQNVLLKAAHAARPFDLIRELNREKPDILHISAHGHKNHGIILVGEDGQPRSVRPQALAELFASLDRPPKIVVLNACFSFAQADEMIKSVDVVVSIPGVILDVNAIAFSSVFYMALCEGVSISKSFRQAVIGVKLNSPNYWQEGEPLIINRAGTSTNESLLPTSSLPVTQPAPVQPRADRLLFNERNLGRGFLRREYEEFVKRLKTAAIILLDVKGMSGINNKYGKPTGDRVLAEILTVIEDSTPSAVACGICGDDTFFCVLESDERQNVIATGRYLMTAIETHGWARLSHDLYVRVEGGFAIWNKAHETASDTVLRTGEALRLAQTDGRQLSETADDIGRRLRGKSLRRAKGIPEEILRQLFS